MKIGVLSDTHGSLTYVNKALDILSDCDFLLHGGDILYHGPRNDLPDGYNPKEVISKLNSVNNILFAKGNCDADVDQMVLNHPIQTPYLLTQFQDIKILLNHGYTDSKQNIVQTAKDMNIDILIFGHTHIKEFTLDDNLIILNPGSTSIPKDGSHSVATIEINKIDGDIKIDVKFIDINSNQFIHVGK